MLIVVSNAEFSKGEAKLINHLFDEGLQVFHLRKPEASASEIQRLLEDLNPIHLTKIALHQHHSLAKAFGIKRLHFPEVNRKNTTAEGNIQLKQEGYTLSTSIHNVEDVADVFDYAFYGPVFESISKNGYKAITNPKLQTPNSKLIAIGGIDENNCIKALVMGFAGVAVLGAIWQTAKPIKQFKKIQSKCSSIAQL